MSIMATDDHTTNEKLKFRKNSASVDDEKHVEMQKIGTEARIATAIRQNIAAEEIQRNDDNENGKKVADIANNSNDQTSNVVINDVEEIDERTALSIVDGGDANESV